MRRRLVSLATAGLLIMSSVAACSDDNGSGGGGDTDAAVPTRGGDGTGKVGVILPDTTTSQRWGSDDPKLLKAAFDAADVPVEIENAQGNPETFRAIGDKMIAGGATVLMIASLDPESGSYVLQRARQAGVQTIDYDRLTLNGAADYYVSFDNEKVGELQAQGLIDCLKQKRKYGKFPRIAYLNGSPTDNNASLFKTGADRVLEPLFNEGRLVKGPDQDVDAWKPETGKAIFTEMWNQYPDDIQGVLAANDALGNAVIEVLQDRGKNGTIPVTGQDAEVVGLQNILAGDQCMTVYKPIKDEAEEAAKLAINLFKGEKVTAADRTKDVESGAYIASVLLDPIAIYKKDVKRVISEGFATKQAVCSGRFATYCPKAGIR